MYMHFSAFMLILYVLLIILIAFRIKLLRNTSIMWFSFKGQKKYWWWKEYHKLWPNHTKGKLLALPSRSAGLVGGSVESKCLLDLKDSVYWGHFPGSNTEYKWSFCLFTQKLRRAPLKAKCTNPNLIKDFYLSECTSKKNNFF